MKWSYLSILLCFSCAEKSSEPRQSAPPQDAALPVETPNKFNPAPYASLNALEVKGFARDIELSSDGTRLAVLTERGVKVFQANDGLLLATLESPVGSLDVDISPDDRWLAVGSEEGALIWDLSDFRLHQKIKSSESVIQFSRDSYVTTEADGVLSIWDVSQQRQIATIGSYWTNKPQQKRELCAGLEAEIPVTSKGVSFWSLQDESGREVFSDWPASDRGSVVSIKDAKTKQEIVEASLYSHGFASTTSRYRWSLSYTSRGETPQMFLMRFDASITECPPSQTSLKLCQTSNSKPKLFPIQQSGAYFTAGAISFSETYLVAVSQDGEVKRWELSDFSQRSEGVLVGFHLGADDVEISTNDRILATRSDDGLVKVWNLETGAFLYTLDGNKRLFEPNKI